MTSKRKDEIGWYRPDLDEDVSLPMQPVAVVIDFGDIGPVQTSDQGMGTVQGRINVGEIIGKKLRVNVTLVADSGDYPGPGPFLCLRVDECSCHLTPRHARDLARSLNEWADKIDAILSEDDEGIVP